MPSQKTPVIEHLFDEYIAGRIADGVVHQRDIIASIEALGSRLSKSNPANFLKDIIRKDTANQNWPDKLKRACITARQRYGATRVFEFRPYAPGQSEPFPNTYAPKDSTPEYTVQSASVPFAARQLGRREESWLMQVVVALHVVETQLAVFSPLRSRLRDVTHLQMSMKTQPEIDAVFLVSHGLPRNISKASDSFSIVTCEAKQLNERILEDQIREQVAVAFSQTEKLVDPDIDAVKPLAVQVRRSGNASSQSKGIYVVEFQRIPRRLFEDRFSPDDSDPERLYRMPLTAVSEAVHHFSPPIQGISE